MPSSLEQGCGSALPAEVRKLSVSFSGKRVFRNVSFRVREGESLVVLGGNGSGKTTLARTLAGVIPEFIPAALSGSVSCNRAALVMQNPSSQFFAMTVKEELGEKGKRAARRFSASRLLERNVFELSEGEKQKINLVAALSYEPRLLLLDEPIELLDPVESRRFSASLEKAGCSKIWFDKGSEAVSGMRIFRLDKARKPLLPEKASRARGETVLEADVSLEKDGFAIRNASLELMEGEKAAVIGLNGSGKSTLLKALAGVENFNGRVKAKKGFSLAPQNPSHLFFQETAEAELVDKANAAILGISGILRISPSSLSMGMQKMLSLATIAPGKIALLDEPTTWLDWQNKEKVYRFVNSSRETMLIATHDRHLLKYCDRVFLLKKGVLRECSSTAANRFFQG